MSLVSADESGDEIISKSDNKYQQIINEQIHPILDESYIHLNHIKIMVSILLYIFSLKVIEKRVVTPEVLNLKNKIIKFRKKEILLINDFDEIRMIIEFFKFICNNHIGVYNYIEARWNKIKIMGDKTLSEVTCILYRMIRIFIYNRQLLFPFTNHNKNKSYSTFNEFWDLFDDLDKLIDDLKLDSIFKIKYSFLYEIIDIVVKCIFKNGSYSNYYNFTDHPYTESTESTDITLSNISQSYIKYYDIVKEDFIAPIKEINETLQEKITKCDIDLNLIDITIEEISSISEDVEILMKQMEELSKLSKIINDKFHDHIKEIFTNSILTEKQLYNQFESDFYRYMKSIEILKTEFSNE